MSNIPADPLRLPVGHVIQVDIPAHARPRYVPENCIDGVARFQDFPADAESPPPPESLLPWAGVRSDHKQFDLRVIPIDDCIHILRASVHSSYKRYFSLQVPV